MAVFGPLCLGMQMTRFQTCYKLKRIATNKQNQIKVIKIKERKKIEES